VERPDMRIPNAALGELPEHGRVLESAVSLLAADPRVEALYLSGSLAAGTPDRWSDIDLWIVVQGGDIEEVINAHRSLIEQVAPIGTLFPATHLGNPHQIIVFYKEAHPIHVDYQYTEARELVPRRRDAEVAILLDRTGEATRWRNACREVDEPPLTADRIQYFEDRFWAWCWYTHGKIQRGELWESRSAVEYLQSNVLVPLAAAGLGLPEEGNRRLETKLPPRVLNLLARTIPDEHSQRAYTAALLATIQAYRELFESLPANVRGEIRLVDRPFFQGAIDSARPIS
jgi:hypothetical protein